MSKIEWTDKTWNPVWGCKAGCDYCYAKGIAKRFASQIARNEVIHYSKEVNVPITLQAEFDDEMGDYFNEIENDIENFEPTFLNSTFENFKFTKKPSKIFVGSMSDIAFWKDEWLMKLVSKIKSYPQHTFQLLTKFPKVYQKLDKIMPDNVWFGVTITKESEVGKMRILNEYSGKSRIKYVSFEPLIEDLGFINISYVDWVIIGTMSGKKRKPTNNDLVTQIVNICKKKNVPVFIKQLEINGKVEKDISKFPKELQLREFPS